MNSMNAIKTAMEMFGCDTKYIQHLQVYGDLPIGKGMGSSAAFSVAVVSAIMAACQPINTEPDKKAIFEAAWKLEQIFHGVSSGVDICPSVYGGICRYNGQRWQNIQKLSFSGNVMIVDSGVSRVTKKVNETLRKLEEEDPEEFSRLFQTIQSIVEKLCNNEMSLSSAIEENQKCLAAMQLMHPKMDEIMTVCKRFNYACKITGAGLGGCVLVYTSGEFDSNFCKELHQIGIECTIPYSLEEIAEFDGVQVSFE